MPDSSPRHPTEADATWPGCHGVRLEPTELAEGYGRSSGDPLLEAELATGPAGPPGLQELWHFAGELDVHGRRVAYDQRLTRRTDGTFVVLADSGALHVDAASARLTIEATGESLARQLVTTYGLPLLLVGKPACVLHACAAVPPDGDRAVVVCGSSGVGKSGLLVALIENGWQAVSEDLCVIDLRHDQPSVWPGPPWVRRSAHGPSGAASRFQTADKTAWDIAPWQTGRASLVAHLVFMEPAGGDATVCERISTADAIPRFVHHNVWLGWPPKRAETTFRPAVTVASSAPAARLRLSVASDWAKEAVVVLSDLVSRT